MWDISLNQEKISTFKDANVRHEAQLQHCGCGHLGNIAACTKDACVGIGLYTRFSGCYFSLNREPGMTMNMDENKLAESYCKRIHTLLSSKYHEKDNGGKLRDTDDRPKSWNFHLEAVSKEERKQRARSNKNRAAFPKLGER